MVGDWGCNVGGLQVRLGCIIITTTTITIIIIITPPPPSSTNLKLRLAPF